MLALAAFQKDTLLNLFGFAFWQTAENLGEDTSQKVSCLTPFPFPVFFVTDSRLPFFPFRAFPFSRLTPSLFPDSRLFFPTNASFPDLVVYRLCLHVLCHQS